VSPGAADRASAGAGRLAGLWRRLAPDQRLAAFASLALLLTMFLPWYQLTVGVGSQLRTVDKSAFGVFSFIEAAVLLVALAVVALLYARAERRAFHLPGGDGTVLLAAGGWATLLLVWRAFDKPGIKGPGLVGIQWGFIFAFGAAGVLTYAGYRVRAAHRPEPDNPTAVVPPGDPITAATEVAPRTGRLRRARADGDEQLTIPLEPERAPERPSLLDDELTRPHGSEPPLPRDDLTLELGDEPGPRRRS
jgi:hypothetical protein